MEPKFKVVFDSKRITLPTVMAFINADGSKDLYDQISALHGLVSDCLWDIENSRYTSDPNDFLDFISSITLQDLDGFVSEIADQIKLMNMWNSAINYEDN